MSESIYWRFVARVAKTPSIGHSMLRKTSVVCTTIGGLAWNVYFALHPMVKDAQKRHQNSLEESAKAVAAFAHNHLKDHSHQ